MAADIGTLNRPSSHSTERHPSMIHDHRPFLIKQVYHRLEYWYARQFIEPQLADLGQGYHMMKPWNIDVHGSEIRIGRHVHIVTAKDRRVSLSTWQFQDLQGHIDIGDHVLLCPGVRLDSASQIAIGNNCMLAAGSYVTDADWHDLYDRTRVIGTTRPVTLADNVWIGDGSIICKGVSIGENSVVGAGSVVAGDIPENVIAAGNPAKVLRKLDPAKELVTRQEIFRDAEALQHRNEQIDRYALHSNSLSGWFRSTFFPRRGD